MEQDAFKRKNSVFLLKVGVQTPTFIKKCSVGFMIHSLGLQYFTVDVILLMIRLDIMDRQMSNHLIINGLSDMKESEEEIKHITCDKVKQRKSKGKRNTINP